MIYETHTRFALSTIFNQVEEIGTPYRRKVKSTNDFITKAINSHRTCPIFANVFENKDNIIKINKLFFDFDYKDKRIVEMDVETTMNNLIERGIPEKDIIRVWTTNKGDHLYTKLKSLHINTKEKNEETNNLLIDEWSWKVRGFQKAVTKGCISVDSSTFGEFSRMARVPGIQRNDNGLIPIIVGLRGKINKWLREYKNWNSRIEVGNELLENWGYGEKNIKEIIKKEDYINTVMYHNIKLPDIPNIQVKPVTNTFGGKYKENLIPIFKQNMSNIFIKKTFDKYADNNTRVALGRSLLEMFGPNNLIIICNLIAMIGWVNFDWGYTYNKLNDIIKWK